MSGRRVHEMETGPIWLDVGHGTRLPGWVSVSEDGSYMKFSVMTDQDDIGFWFDGDGSGL